MANYPPVEYFAPPTPGVRRTVRQVGALVAPTQKVSKRVSAAGQVSLPKTGQLWPR